MTRTPDTPDTLDTALARGFAWTAGAKWATQLITWGSVVVAARLLSPGDFGLVDMSAFFVGITNVVAEFGLASAVMQMRELDRRVLGQLNTLSVLLGMVAFGCSAMAAPLVASFFHSDKLQVLVVVNSVSLLITGFQAVPLGLLLKDMDYRRLSLAEASMAFGQAVLLTICVLLKMSYWSLVIAVIGGKTISALLTLYWKPVAFRRPRWRDVRGPAQLGWHLTVSRVGWAAYAQADGIVVGRTIGNSALGAYRIAIDLASAPSEKLGMLIMRVTGPLFASVQTDLAVVRRYFVHFTELLAISIFPLMFGLSAVAPDLVTVVLGAKWVGAVPTLRWLSIYVAFRTMNTLMGQVLTSLRETRFMMWMSLLTAAVMVPTFFLAARWGVSAVAASWLIVSPLTFGVPAWRLLACLRLSAGEYWRVLRPALVSCTAMAGAVLLVAGWLPQHTPVYVRLVCQVFLGGLVYIGILSLVFRQTVLRYLNFLRRLWQRHMTGATVEAINEDGVR